MLELFILAIVLYVICSAIFGSSDRKDEKRWPYLMRQEKEFLKIGKEHGISAAKQLATTMRKQREKARKNEKMAKILDELEASARQTYHENHTQRQAQQQTADMQRKIADMQKQIDILERENRYRY